MWFDELQESFKMIREAITGEPHPEDIDPNEALGELVDYLEIRNRIKLKGDKQ